MNINKYSYELENNEDYEISYYYFEIEDDLFLCIVSQNIEDGSDMDLSVASTRDEYELDELLLDEDTMITKKEFEKLYEKLKNKFEIDMFK